MDVTFHNMPQRQLIATNVIESNSKSEENPIVGGFEPLDSKAMMQKWELVLQKATISKHAKLTSIRELSYLGNLVSAQRQVVAGINYQFLFSGGTIVNVFEQVW